MNPEQLLNLAESVIVEANADDAFRWVIVVRRRKIRCVPKKDVVPSETVIMELDQHQVRCGLTSDGWVTLRQSLAKYWKEQSL